MAKINEFFFKVEIELELTRAEVEHLVGCSKVHYDFKCKHSAEVGGFIHGWRNHFRNHFEKGVNETLSEADLSATATVRATWNQMDLACKILEMEQHLDQGDGMFLSIVFRRILLNMAEESKRVNDDGATPQSASDSSS